MNNYNVIFQGEESQVLGYFIVVNLYSLNESNAKIEAYSYLLDNNIDDKNCIVEEIELLNINRSQENSMLISISGRVYYDICD